MIMEEEKDYIRIPATIMDNDIFRDANVFSIWLFLMLKANTKDTNDFGLEIKRGQVVMSYVNLSHQTGVKLEKIEGVLRKLKRMGEVKVTKKNGYTTYTMLNFEYYA